MATATADGDFGFCTACYLLEQWVRHTDSYADRLVNALSPALTATAIAVMTLYWVIWIGMRVVLGQEFSPGEFLKSVFISIVACTVLARPVLWIDIVNTISEFGTDLATFAATKGEGVSFGHSTVESYERIKPLGEAISTITTEPARRIFAAFDGIAWGDPIGMLGALLLWAAYALLMIFVVVDIVFLYTTFIVVKALGPLIVTLAIPSWTRGASVTAFRLLLGSVFQFGAIGVLLGLAFAFAQEVNSSIPTSGTQTNPAPGCSSNIHCPPNVTDTVPEGYWFGAEYLVALAAAVLLFYLRGALQKVALQMGEAVGLAGPTLSGVVTKGFGAYRNWTFLNTQKPLGSSISQAYSQLPTLARNNKAA